GDADCYLRTEGKMKPRKPKPSEPSPRDKLAAGFLKAFENDFETHGVEVIERLREKHPDRYAELAARLIATTEPKSDGPETANDFHEMAFRLLKSIGMSEFDITEAMIQEAIDANNVFIDRLQAIRDGAQGQGGEFN